MGLQEHAGDKEEAPDAQEMAPQEEVSAEGQEGLRAFLEKRKPRWSL